MSQTHRAKFEIIHSCDNEERKSIIDETNFKTGKNFGPGTMVIGLDGYVYENYGSEEKPMWEAIFDANYKINII